MKAFQAIISAAVAALACYLGTLLVPLIMLIVVMILDYVTGMMKAWITSTLSSRTGVKGIVKKLLYFVAVCVAMVCDWLIGSGLATAGVDGINFVFISVLVIVWLILNELISILENLAAIGVPLPAFLVKLIHRLKVSTEKSGEDLTGEEKEGEQHDEP